MTKKMKPVQQVTKSKTKKKMKKKTRLNVEKLKELLLEKEENDLVEVVPAPSQKQKKKPASLREKMMAKLKSSRFRFLNEKLYSSGSSESKQLFKEDPGAFFAYHEGYKTQVEQWPINPVDVIITAIKKLPKEFIIADLGCGEAKLAASVPHKVHSFDLVAVNDKVRACDMAHTPLLSSGVNVVVFCLSLMGTNLKDYIIEANRVLKIGGLLKIAEVESRFDKVDDFIKSLKEFGFANTHKDFSNNLFYFLDFKKEKDYVKSKKNNDISLKPCLYKKR